MSYPPEPWDLAGSGHLAVWRIDADALATLPHSVRAASVRGRALVVTAFVDYTEVGDLAYRELLAAVLVRYGHGLALSITDIWVDSPTSLEGGRALWGIPKDLAEFDGLAAVDHSGPIASASYRARRRAPVVALPTLPSSVVQTLDEQTVASPIRAGGAVRLARSDWHFPAAGPLGWLRSATPVVSLVAPRFAMRFGRAA